jgi:ABC-type multidrug transport system fused ATPase/permease subunit
MFPRRPDLFTANGKPVDVENSSSAFQKYSMQWCSSALRMAGRNLKVDELPVLDHFTRSKSQKLITVGSFERTLWDQILFERYLAIIKQWTLMLIRAIATFGPPYCVMRLLESLEASSDDMDNGWVWLIGIGLSSACQTVINHHLIWIQWSEMGIPIRAQLIMAIFQKVLRMKDSKDQGASSSKKGTDKPEAISLISSDTLSFSKFTAVNYIIPSSFVKFLFAVLFLVRLLGWQSTLVGMIITVVCVPVHTIIIKQQRAAQNNLTKARDRKTKAITEALHTLRQIKFTASETQWEAHIRLLRQEEMKHLRRSFTIANLRSTWAITAPFIVATASIYTYAHFEGSVSPSIVLPMIEVLPHLQGTLGFVPVIFQDYFGARSNASRIDEFLKRPEQKNDLGPSPSGNVSFRDVSVAWPYNEAVDDIQKEKQPNIRQYHRFSLHNMTLDFPVGELSVISGKTGSGKSLLLATIIGEADILSGTANAPSRAKGHPVALVSQTPWLQNATIKDSILFGSPLNRERYEKVLNACALRPDLTALPKGDETKIGLRGVKLSGGQRVRVALARALYSNATLLVLDDIFSALDSHVAKEIFHALTGELGEGRTRILATHHVSLCLPKTKYVVRLGNNTVDYAGKPEGIREVGNEIEGEANLELKPSAKTKRNHGVTKATSKNKPPATKIIRSNARTDLKVYKSYFAAAGGTGFALIFLLGLAIKQVLGATTTWLLGCINSASPKVVASEVKKTILQTNIADESSGTQHYLLLYIWYSLLAIILESLFSLYVVAGSLRASKTLFHEITFRILRMPLLWLDTTPMGEMLKRFTVDTKLTDDLALVTMSEFIDCLAKMMTIVSVG